MTEIYLPTEIEDVEYNLDKLIDSYRELKNENASLKQKQDVLAQENLELLEKTAAAKVRLDAMISRLKAMENS
jgi:cell division protein ZapB